jgi:hypothetical protein
VAYDLFTVHEGMIANIKTQCNEKNAVVRIINI